MGLPDALEVSKQEIVKRATIKGQLRFLSDLLIKYPFEFPNRLMIKFGRIPTVKRDALVSKKDGGGFAFHYTFYSFSVIVV